jgi:putative flippase GtrA
MWRFIWKQYKKYEEIVHYLIFGFLAFVFYLVVYGLAAQLIGADNDHPFLVSVATVIAWVLTVIFAYWTNHTFVFKSKVAGVGGLLRELLKFFGARVVTLLLDLLLTFIMIHYMEVDHMICKVVVEMAVTVCNYLFSKILIFRVSKNTDGGAG